MNTPSFVAVGVAALFAAAPVMAAPNPIQLENAQPGTSAWRMPLAPEPSIDVYTTNPGAVAGGTIEFHVSTEPPARYRIELFRLGWYRGSGGRLVACLPSCSGSEQGNTQPAPAPAGAGDAPVLEAGWPVTDTLTVPSGWTSGYYEARFLLTSGPQVGKAGETFVVVRSASSLRASLILVQVPVNTWQAYNQWGGRSLYDFPPSGYSLQQCAGCGLGRSYRVSFERPYGTYANSPLWWEIQLVRFLEREGYDVSYQTDVDTDADPASLLRHQLVIVAGHDEYWTLGMRSAFDTALARGTNLAFIGSNDGYWVVRYEDDRHTIFSYKSTYDPAPTA